ncbi:MAG: hypothetical protein COW30_00985 [Rhodospirillales bacterium CG15_BIG_FIL_POST_REV_8_21_14_020_66_15]|nr:MAG: hypothetical protein COW30_00985 [Rhodospirillales bacterium CG15_BIG_FIL_POST_REV_8_21_14_020_66_15]
MIGAMEQALVDRVKTAGDGGALGYAIRTVASYGNELDDPLAELVKGQFPAVWFVFRGRTRPRPAAGGAFEAQTTFAGLVATQNRRNERARRRGATGDVGSYQILEDVEALIAGQTLGLDFLTRPIEPGTIDNVLNGKPAGKLNVSIYAIEFILSHYVGVTPDAQGLDDFATLHVDWDIPPHGNVTTQDPAGNGGKHLPAENPDAEDATTLETEA